MENRMISLERNTNETQIELTLNLDGEPLQARRFHIQCVAGRVRMHLPAATALLGS